MISKEIVDFISEKAGIKQRDLVEKDLLLHRLLMELSSDGHFSKNYAFKGGTCLIKCYLGYYRFSEDLDFTWINQGVFSGKTEKQIRKEASRQISMLADLLELIAEKMGIKFRAEKANSRFIEFGGSNKFATFKLWYDSLEIKEEQFIKIQVNYAEHLEYNLQEAAPKSIIDNLDKKEILFLYPELEWLFKKQKIIIYDIKEILIEKARAILTRQGMKPRDFVDIYMIEKDKNLSIENYESKILEKTRFMLKYEKYRSNLRDKQKEAPQFSLGQEETFLLKSLDNDFFMFIIRINKFIERLIIKLAGREVHR